MDMLRRLLGHCYASKKGKGPSMRGPIALRQAWQTCYPGFAPLVSRRMWDQDYMCHAQQHTTTCYAIHQELDSPLAAQSQRELGQPRRAVPGRAAGREGTPLAAQSQRELRQPRRAVPGRAAGREGTPLAAQSQREPRQPRRAVPVRAAGREGTRLHQVDGGLHLLGRASEAQRALGHAARRVRQLHKSTRDLRRSSPPQT